MRYLTLAADYTQSSLRDDFQEPIEPESVGLPKQLCEQLRQWNFEYRKIIPLSEREREDAAVTRQIGRLDELGQELASRIADALAPAKVRYYSEGQQRYLN